MSLAEVCTPVSGFRSTIPRSSCQRNARLRPTPPRLVPTTWPSRFTAFAWLRAPPSVPSSWIATSTTAGPGARGDAFRRRAGDRVASWPTAQPARRSGPSVRRTAAPGWRRARCGSRRPCGRSRPGPRPGCTAVAAGRRPLRPRTRAGCPAPPGCCNRRPTPAGRPWHPSVAAAPSGALFQKSGLSRVRRLRPTCRVELTHQRVSLPALKERVGRLPEQVETHGLCAVGREPSRVVAGCAPAARIERRPPDRDAEQGGRSVRGFQGVGGEGGGGEQDAHLDVRLPEMIPQGLDLEAADRRLLSPTRAQGPAPPDAELDDAFEFEQVSLLRIGQGHTPVDAELGDLEPHFAQFAHDQDLEVFGRELRQFQHPSSLTREGQLRRRGSGLYGNIPGAASPTPTASSGVAPSARGAYIIGQVGMSCTSPTSCAGGDDMQVGRRDFLRLTASAGAGTAIGGLVGLGVTLAPAEARAQELRIKDAKTTPSICPFCSVGCATLIHTVDGKIVNIEGDPRSPHNEGTLCPKGAAIYQLHMNPNRATKVLHRKPGAGDWEVVELEWAMDRVAELIKKTRDETFIEKLPNGKLVNMTPAMFALGGATLDNEFNHVCQKFWRGLGVVAIENQARI